jgi:hypothetical protein
MIEISTPDGSSFSFPDGTPQADITSALDAHFGAAPTEQGSKLGRFLKNVYNNPPPTIAGIRDTIKNAPAAANELTFGSDPAAAERSAGTMLEAASLASPMSAGSAIRRGLPTAAAEPLGPRPIAPAAPNSSMLRTERAANYDAAHALGVEFKPQFVHDAYNDMLAKLGAEFPDATRTLNILGKAANRVRPVEADAMASLTGVKPRQPAPVSSQDFEAVRKELVQVKPTEKGATDATAASRARSMIDDALEKAPADAAAKGDIAAFQSAITEGRANHAAMKRLKVLENAEERGGLNAATAYNGSNVENAGRQSFKSISRPPLGGGPTLAEKIGLNAPERAAVRDVAAPGFLADTVRGVGKLAPTDFVKMIGNAEAAKLTGGMSIPLTGLAYGAKKLGDSMLQKRIDKALGLVGSRSPLYQKQRAEFERQLQEYIAKEVARQRASEGGGLLGNLTLRGLLPLGLEAQQGLLPQLPSQ